jgi:hypothetical protein
MAFRVDLHLRHGFAIEDLTNLLLKNPRYVFQYEDTKLRLRKRRNKGKATYRWAHKQYGGPIRLKKLDGIFWAEVPDSSERGPGRLLGAFVSWLFANAAHMVHRLDVQQSR